MAVGFSLYVFAIQVNLMLAVEPFRSECERLGVFKGAEKGYSLSVNALSNHQVTKSVECTFLCMNHKLCKSYNYQHQTSGSTHTCELLDQTQADSPSAYISRPGFAHYETQKSGAAVCEDNPCRNGGTCFLSCGGFRCVCAEIFKGQNCEIDERTFTSCNEIQAAQPPVDRSSGYWLTIGSQHFPVFCDNGWTLIARFSNSDGKNWMSNSGSFWFDSQTPRGTRVKANHNQDMLSDAFWLLKGAEFKITKSDDPTHIALLETQGRCLNGLTFRAKISSYGIFKGSTVWASDSCQGNCNIKYNGAYTGVEGFGQSQCDGDLQTKEKIGFWCDYSSGDGAVMMIGGGGSNCKRADHGIGITEANSARFDGGAEFDFGNDASSPSDKYSLNLWVR